MKISNLKIRKAVASDLVQISDWQLKMALETEKLALDPATLKKGIQRLFDEPGLGQYWIAEAEGKALGCTLTLGEWSDWRNGFVLWIHSVFIEKEFRKAGIFSAIYNHLKAEVSSSEELKGLRLYVDQKNTPAQEVYKRVGMNGDHYQLFEWLQEA